LAASNDFLASISRKEYPVYCFDRTRKDAMNDGDAMGLLKARNDIIAARANGAGDIVPRATLASGVVDRIRRKILSSEFPEGAVLKQDELAIEMGVSRIPVREALRELAAEGLVTLMPHHRACVSQLTSDELRDLVDLRLWIEPNLVRLSIEVCTDAHIEKASQILAEFCAIPDEDPAAWSDANCRFHVALCEPSGRDRAVKIVENLLKNTSRYRTKIVISGGRDTAHSDHSEILEMFKRRDSIAGASLLRKHILDWHSQLKFTP
jgi:DNA-binding GntR family transcriptional regulator